MNKLITLELGKVASATGAEFLRKLQPLMEVDFSTQDIHTADLLKVDIDSVLLKAAVCLYFFNKKRNVYPFALQIADYAVVGQIISQNLLLRVQYGEQIQYSLNTPEDIRSEYFNELPRQNWLVGLSKVGQGSQSCTTPKD